MFTGNPIFDATITYMAIRAGWELIKFVFGD